MEDIKHTYTLQWVGPLTYDEYKEYVKGTDTIHRVISISITLRLGKMHGVVGGVM